MTRFIKKRQGKKSSQKGNLPVGKLPISKPKKRQQTVKYADNLKGSSQIYDGNRMSGWDITMCKGGKCPFKDMCHRYTALPDELYQSYFTTPPFKIDKGKPSCQMYWGDAAQSLFIMLKEMMENPVPKKKKRH